LRVVKAGVLLLTLALAPSANAQPATAPYAPARAPGARTHDGFYLRLQLGLGYTRLSSSLNGTDRRIAGGGTGFDIALGGALNPHVIVYGTFINSTGRDVRSSYSGRTPDTSGAGYGMISGTTDVGFQGPAEVVAVGGGVAYYLDSNLFFGGSLLGSQLLLVGPNGNIMARTNVGFTFEGLFGKEWWVSDNWGLGVAGRLLLGAMKDRPLANETDVATWKLAAFSVLFSATYN
jgi:hypothetical protein